MLVLKYAMSKINQLWLIPTGTFLLRNARVTSPSWVLVSCKAECDMLIRGGGGAPWGPVGLGPGLCEQLLL